MGMDPVVLFRRGGYEDELRLEAPAFEKHFPSLSSVSEMGKGKLVIGRFALRPFYKEVELEIAKQGSSLLNPYNHYRWINEMPRWYEHLAEFTPRTWFYTSEVDIDGPFFVKGNTNSRKSHWETHCYAQDGQALSKVVDRLHEDPMIGTQGLAIREFVPLQNLGVHPQSGAPISEEYRFFVCDHTVLGGGFYWSDHLANIDDGADLDPKHVPAEFLERIMDAVPSSVRFYVLDVARRQDGEWMLVEINEPSMSGMAGCDPQEVYANLSKVLLEESKAAKPRRKRRAPADKTSLSEVVWDTSTKSKKSSASKAAKTAQPVKKTSASAKKTSASKSKQPVKKSASSTKKQAIKAEALPEAKEQMLKVADAFKNLATSKSNEEGTQGKNAPVAKSGTAPPMAGSAPLSELIKKLKHDADTS